MTWVAPPTFTSGAALTAAQLNTLSGDLNETAAAKATGAGQWFVSTGSNSLAARTVGNDSASVSETTASTTFADLATVGPSATVTSGTNAFVFMSAFLGNSNANATSSIGLDISGATTVAASAIWLSITTPNVTGAQNNAITCSAARVVAGLTAGSNTFTMKYVVSVGTGTFNRRFLSVLSM